MDSIVLAGGFAKRMWPLTKNTPKQLLDVAGKPMLTHVLKSLERINPERVIVSVNSFFATNFENYINNYEGPLNLELFVESSNNEEEKLGALGALNLLFSEYSIKGPVFIAGGDNLSNFDLNQMVRRYQETKKDVIGLYDVEDLELAKLYGIAETNNESITDFHEKPSKPKSTLAATAYWLLSEKGIINFLDYINSGGDRDALGNFLAWHIQKTDVKSVSFRGVWYDIGDLESYNTARKWLSN